ncbi:hypothetical protein, partial [Pannonibacter sp. I15F10I1]|uniref:hypothetical protein n=1 Tax=Pannonibacter sp. I15F10I1 TaxID=2003580 RepID=UPI001AD8AAD2
RTLLLRGSGKASKQAANLLIATSRDGELMNRFASVKQPLIRHTRFPCPWWGGVRGGGLSLQGVEKQNFS